MSAAKERREAVARLTKRGRTAAQIADELGVTKRTREAASLRLYERKMWPKIEAVWAR